MGHRLSKTTLTGSQVATNKSQRKRNSSKFLTTSTAAADTTTTASTSTEISQSESNSSSTAVATAVAVASVANLEQQLVNSNLRPTINVITDTNFRFEARKDSSCSSNGPQQIIIKIQLAKMEPGENEAQYSSLSGSSNNNLNVERSNLTVNGSFQRNITCEQDNEVKLNNLNVNPTVMNNNNFVSNFAALPFVGDDQRTEGRSRTNVQNFDIMIREMGNCQIVENANEARQRSNNNDSGSNRSSTSSSGFSDAMSELVDVDVAGSLSTSRTKPTAAAAYAEESKKHCCRRKKSSTSPSSPNPNSSSSSSSSAYPLKRRCCKCTCRDAINKLLPSSSRKQNQQLPASSNNPMAEMQPLAAASSVSNEMPPTAGNHLAIWSPANNGIMTIPLASPQIVVVQYPPVSAASHLVALGPIANIEEHAIRLMAGDITVPTTPDSTNSMAASPCSTMSTATTPNGTVVHSQVDYIHCLVPDLERITKSTFYWGKMDRYEAERLLEGKPEGTFLLRDSAQEEYLFSVTFRKYGRSLHARIEQFNHRFSFDCHDPGVFTASTVTDLLEHYKDPSCVMFFEPMLTIPLHRNTTFSLQQLCRATIVSHTTYDGISELEIPSRLKSYLKEYHYKQRVRVKPFDETFYSCT